MLVNAGCFNWDAANVASLCMCGVYNTPPLFFLISLSISGSCWLFDDEQTPNWQRYTHTHTHYMYTQFHDEFMKWCDAIWCYATNVLGISVKATASIIFLCFWYFGNKNGHKKKIDMKSTICWCLNRALESLINEKCIEYFGAHLKWDIASVIAWH